MQPTTVQPETLRFIKVQDFFSNSDNPPWQRLKGATEIKFNKTHKRVDVSFTNADGDPCTLRSIFWATTSSASLSIREKPRWRTTRWATNAPWSWTASVIWPQPWTASRWNSAAPILAKYIGFGDNSREMMEGHAEIVGHSRLKHRHNQIPLDGIHIDVDIQYLYQTFTVNDARYQYRAPFADPVGMFGYLKSPGVKCSANCSHIPFTTPLFIRSGAIIPRLEQEQLVGEYRYRR